MSDGVKLFVYGVSASCPRDLLESEFGKCGRVNDIFNTGKGYCFVTMADERDAKIAVEDLNGTTMDGQEIKVEISHGKGSTRPRDGGRRGGGFGGRRDDRRGGRDDRRGGGFDRRGGGRRDDRRSGGFGGRRDDRRDDRGRRDDRYEDRSRDRSYNRRDDY